MRVEKLLGMLAAIATLALFGCPSGGGDTQPSPPAPPVQPATTEPAQPPTPTPVKAPVVNPAAPAKTPAKAPEKELSFEERVKASTPTVPTPAPQSAGAVKLSAELCTLDGPPIIGDSPFNTIGQIAQASDGTIYVLDNMLEYKRSVRRYKVLPGPGCKLQMDTGFGVNGLLKLSEGIGRAPEGISADGRGHVFVSSSMGGSWRITGNTMDYHCAKSRGKVSIDPSGTTGIALFGSSNPQKVTYTDTGCSIEPLKLADSFERLDAVAFFGKRLFVGGSNKVDGRAGPHQAREFDLSGKAIGAAFGTAEFGDEEHFCHIHGFPQCSHGVCVLDGNCRDLRIWNNKLGFIGAADLSKMIGLRYPWISGLTPAIKGTSYLSATQERGDTDVYDGFIYRVAGM